MNASIAAGDPRLIGGVGEDDAGFTRASLLADGAVLNFPLALSDR
jgi:hypothetical protein